MKNIKKCRKILKKYKNYSKNLKIPVKNFIKVFKKIKARKIINIFPKTIYKFKKVQKSSQNYKKSSKKNQNLNFESKRSKNSKIIQISFLKKFLKLIKTFLMIQKSSKASKNSKNCQY